MKVFSIELRNKKGNLNSKVRLFKTVTALRKVNQLTNALSGPGSVHITYYSNIVSSNMFRVY